VLLPAEALPWRRSSLVLSRARPAGAPCSSRPWTSRHRAALLLSLPAHRPHGRFALAHGGSLSSPCRAPCTQPRAPLLGLVLVFFPERPADAPSLVASVVVEHVSCRGLASPGSSLQSLPRRRRSLNSTRGSSWVSATTSARHGLVEFSSASRRSCRSFHRVRTSPSSHPLSSP
jgi:hypothetical protein